MELEKAALLASLTLTCWTGLALLVDRRGHRGINIYLAVLLATLIAPLVYFYSSTLTVGGWQPAGQLALAGIWAKGPLLRSLTGAAVTAPLARPPLHFIPFVLALVVMPLFPGFTQLLGLAGLCHALCYQVASVRLLHRNRQQLLRIYSGYPNSAYYWLLFVIAGLGAVMVLDFTLMGSGFATQVMPMTAIKIVTLITVAYLVVTALCSLFRPKVFFGIGAPAEVVSSESETIDTASPPQAEDRSPRELTAGAAAELARALEDIMTKQQLYLDPELSLKSLAEILGASPHQTSELLNLHIGTGFYQYLNNRRLKHAEALLSDGHDDQHVIDIAFNSGFSNKNTFYRLFRETYGTTPVAYRNTRRSQKGFLKT